MGSGWCRRSVGRRVVSRRIDALVRDQNNSARVDTRVGPDPDADLRVERNSSGIPRWGGPEPLQYLPAGYLEAPGSISRSDQMVVSNR